MIEAIAAAFAACWIGTGVWLGRKNVSPQARWPYFGIGLQLAGFIVLLAAFD